MKKTSLALIAFLMMTIAFTLMLANPNNPLYWAGQPLDDSLVRAIAWALSCMALGTAYQAGLAS
jgi:hypothetical protein